VAHRAGPDQVVERRQRLLDRRARIGLVQLVEVDLLGPQPPQRTLHGGLHVPARAARHRLGRDGAAHVRAELGGQHDAVPAAAEHPAEQLLRGPLAAVDVGGVEQRDPGVQRGVHHRPGLLEIGPLAEIRAAQADDGDGRAGAAELPEAHGRRLTDR